MFEVTLLYLDISFKIVLLHKFFHLSKCFVIFFQRIVILCLFQMLRKQWLITCLYLKLGKNFCQRYSFLLLAKSSFGLKPHMPVSSYISWESLSKNVLAWEGYMVFSELKYSGTCTGTAKMA